MPRTEFHCPHVIGARRLFFSVHSWSGVRTEGRKILLEVDSEPMGIDARVLGMPRALSSEGPSVEEACVGKLPSL